MRRTSFLIFALTWLIAVGHCLAENLHAHAKQEKRSGTHHHHHHESGEQSNPQNQHGVPCELQDLQLNLHARSALEALQLIFSSNVAWAPFHFSAADQLADHQFVLRFQSSEPPSFFKPHAHLTTSLRSAPNAPPFSL